MNGMTDIGRRKGGGERGRELFFPLAAIAGHFRSAFRFAVAAAVVVRCVPKRGISRVFIFVFVFTLFVRWFVRSLPISVSAQRPSFFAFVGKSGREGRIGGGIQTVSLKGRSLINSSLSAPCSKFVPD